MDIKSRVKPSVRDRSRARHFRWIRHGFLPDAMTPIMRHDRLRVMFSKMDPLAGSPWSAAGTILALMESLPARQRSFDYEYNLPQPGLLPTGKMPVIYEASFRRDSPVLPA